ncbi:MAG: hypothetical protein HC831_07775 [Chloroflexia bacterium]|nr:hypothetical protein [Chloroflexia bacterium]
MGLSIDEFRDLIPVDFAEHMRFFELKEDAKRDREWEQVRYIAHKVIIANYLDPKQLPKDEKELFRLPREEQEYQEDSENFNKNMENFNWDAPIRL